MGYTFAAFTTVVDDFCSLYGVVTVAIPETMVRTLGYLVGSLFILPLKISPTPTSWNSSMTVLNGLAISGEPEEKAGEEGSENKGEGA